MLKLVDTSTDAGIEDVIHVLRLSLAPQHSEFGYTNDEKKDKEIDAKLQDMVDLRDLQILSQFALSGTIPKEEEIAIPSVMIDMTAKN